MRSHELHGTTVTHFYGCINGFVFTSLNFNAKSIKEINVQLTLNGIVHDGHDINSIKKYKAKQGEDH